MFISYLLWQAWQVKFADIICDLELLLFESKGTPASSPPGPPSHFRI